MTEFVPSMNGFAKYNSKIWAKICSALILMLNQKIANLVPTVDMYFTGF